MAEYTPEELARYPISIGRRKPFYERFGIPRSEPYQPPDCGDTLEQLIEQDRRSRLGLQGGSPVQFSAVFDEGAHPRDPKGVETGGRFTASHAAVQSSQSAYNTAKKAGANRIVMAGHSRTLREAHDEHFLAESAMKADPNYGSLLLTDDPLYMDYSGGQDVRDAWSDIVGDHVSVFDAAKIIGAIPGGVTRISTDKHARTVIIKGKTNGVRWGYGFYRDKGKLVCEMDSYFVDEHLQGQGIGKKMLQQMVSALTKAGFSRIECHAARKNTNADANPMGGYSAWPYLGFDQRS